MDLLSEDFRKEAPGCLMKKMSPFYTEGDIFLRFTNSRFGILHRGLLASASFLLSAVLVLLRRWAAKLSTLRIASIFTHYISQKLTWCSCLQRRRSWKAQPPPPFHGISLEHNRDHNPHPSPGD